MLYFFLINYKTLFFMNINYSHKKKDKITKKMKVNHKNLNIRVSNF